MAFLAAPSVAVLSNLKVKEAKVAKLFDMEEEDARDSDSENEKTEKEQNPSEKFFKSILASVILPELGAATLIHYTRFQCPVSDTIKELITPPPRA
ncbi:MAG: hypothetical protein K0R51_320 [Cytophagaceae bacterium]|jgi:hypothetical protein|nr:hypothetical protein [Cytophagaceae bacterium]